MTKPQIDWKSRLDELRALVAAGAGYREISDHFGCSYPCAGRAVREYTGGVDKAAAHARRVARAKALAADPEVNEKRKASLKAAYEKPGLRERKALDSKRRWRDPEKRAQWEAALKAAHGTPEMRRRKSEQSKQRWQDPEIAERMKAGTRAFRRRQREEAEMEARVATMTPFERQLWLIDTGRARITERPVLRAAEYHRTMGGVVGDYSI